MSTSIYHSLIVGAGISGIAMLNKLKNLGLNAKIYEKSSDIDGTWYRNRYPGAKCDVPSVEYELQQKWEWEEKFSTQQIFSNI